ncbi:hypothetical protein EB118_06470 [bacterium]|nr:hypothetical protein [bacterium]NBX97710.1 hypothetical protein [bacterium]NDC94217.1 hypothetical protein [bacterium]NDD84406.1 hypothetical protein [bacterium]NDG29722.1 hypothetical protein [bacterium]
MSVTLSIAVISAALNILIATLIAARGLKNSINITFFSLSLIIAIWSVAIGISTDTGSVKISEITSQITYGLSGVVVALSLLFIVLLGARSRQYQKKLINRIGFLSLFLLPFFFTRLVYYAIGIDEFGYGILAPVYVVYLLGGLVLMAREIFFTLNNGSQTQKQQTKIVANGLLITIASVGILNVLIPTITGNESVTAISPIMSVFFVSVTGYAIIKHKFFDFKAVVARAAAYLLTTVILVVTYVGLAFMAKKILFPETIVTTLQLISNIALSILLVVSYPYIKRGFNRFTNRYFFRDAYDPQLFLDELNKTLVSSLDISELLQKSSLIIDANLKSQSCSFYIRDTSYFSSRLLGDNQAKITELEMRTIQDLLVRVHKKVITTALDGDTPEEAEIIEILKKHNIEILARLESKPNLDSVGIGYFVLGSKRSGNMYSSQDVKIIEIVANELVIAVENSMRFEEIEQFNVTLQKKIDNATTALKRSNTKLVALDEAKDEFISMASHQLRTPLTSVKGYLSMLAEGDAGNLNETQKKFIDQAFISSQRMVYLIADLLNVSRLKTGKFVIEATEVYLPDVIESEIAQLSETVKSRELTMVFNKPETFPKMQLDETKIRQVIMNFADNAIYYTPAGGKIVINLEEVKGVAEFTVTDTGLGVPKAEQHHLFTKFYRAGNARKARPDGTGLGLFMAKKVIVASGGAIIFKSVLGKGSTFGFRFNIPKTK